ncbi:MAG: MurR/RpiR family transcriptional regulator [Firmicutes bacterium]|nr:MurR/RpiR family transcriptional regulator [Bacillota bacterium]
MDNRITFFDRVAKSKDKLTKKQLKLAEFIMRNYKTAVFLSSIELGEQVDTSEATVIRLANALGYLGYTDLIKDIQSYIKEEITTIDKLENLGNIYKDKSILDEVLKNNSLMIKSLKKYIRQDDIEKITEDMSKYKRIVIVGFESSAGLAEYIGYNLVRMAQNVEVVTHNYGNIFNLINNVDDRTFVIVISFPRYSNKVVKLARLFKNKDAKTFVVTDSEMSPLIKYGDYSITIPVHDNYISNLDVSVAVITLFQGIMLQYGAINYNQVKKKLKDLEEFNKDYEMFFINE